MKLVLFILLAFIATTIAFKVKIHSPAQNLAERIARRLENALASKNGARVAAQFHHDFHYHGCRGKHARLPELLESFSKFPEEHEYEIRVIYAKKIGHKSIKYSVSKIYDSHAATYEYIATRHHGRYVLEKATRTDCHLRGFY